MTTLLAISALLLSYANGANDNFKGVATLYGGKVWSYRRSLLWATASTFAGSILSLFLASKLLRLFSGKGIVLPAVLSNPAFLTAIACGAAFTVLLATRFGFPVSTTHSLVGALTGAGFASGGIISFAELGASFFLPLLIGPLIAVGITYALYKLLHEIRIKSGIQDTFCVCVGDLQEPIMTSSGMLALQSTGARLTVQEEQYCRNVYSGMPAGWNVQRIMDRAHILSAGAVSLARGLNDTPKIAALLLFAPFLPSGTALILVALWMGIGGVLHSRRIAQRMSFEITEMNPGQAFTANFVTALLVITGSLLGYPLSTTHVSCGSIFGLGIVNKNAKTKTISQILLAWVFTLPLAALLAAVTWIALQQ